MLDCKFLETEDITSYHSDIFDHPVYKHTCKKWNKDVIPYLRCNGEKCKNYTKVNT
jgi:hypothetical protein